MELYIDDKKEPLILQPSKEQQQHGLMEGLNYISGLYIELHNAGNHWRIGRMYPLQWNTASIRCHGNLLADSKGCWGCDHPNARNCCGKCKGPKYCGEACQQKDWEEGHKNECI